MDQKSSILFLLLYGRNLVTISQIMQLGTNSRLFCCFIASLPPLDPGIREFPRFKSLFHLHRRGLLKGRSQLILCIRIYPKARFRVQDSVNEKLLALNDVFGVQNLQGQIDLSGVKFVLLFKKFIFQGKQLKEFTPWTVLKNKVQLVLVLETLFEFDQEGMLQLTEDTFLSHYIFLLVIFDYVLLLQHFHSIDLLVTQAQGRRT